MLDVCSGPGIRDIISASSVYTRITVMEYTERNRAFLMKWVKKDDGEHDWSRLLAHVADLERYLTA